MATPIRQATAAVLRAGTLVGLLALSLLGATGARAQCVQTGTDVTCTGTDPDGFTAAEDGLTVSVQPGATVQNGVSGRAIQVQQTSSVTVEQGASVTASGTGAVGVAGVSGNTVTNRGDVIVSGAGPAGIDLGSQGVFTNESTGRVLVAPPIGGGATTGVRTGDGSTSTNDGLIQASGDGSVGFVTGMQSQLTNTGTIATPGGGATGVNVGTLSTVTNSGQIQSNGDGGVGVVLGTVGSLDNTGTIEASGSGGTGVRVEGGRASIRNGGVIRAGDGGTGVLFTAFGTNSNPNFLNNVSGGLITAGTGGVAVQGSAGADFIVNAGDINGDVRLGTGDDLFDWGAGSTVTGTLDGGGQNQGDAINLFQPDPSAPVDDVFDLGSATNVETLYVGAPGDTGTWTLTGAGDYSSGIILESGTAQIADGTAIVNPFDVRAGVARLGDGTSFSAGITVSGGQVVFADGASVQGNVDASAGSVRTEGPASLQGDLTLGVGTTYGATIDGATSPELDVQGAIAIGPGAQLVLTRTDFAPGTQSYRLLSSTGGISGQLEPTGAFQKITQTYGPSFGPTFLDVTVESTFTLPALSANQLAVGQALDLAASSPDPPSADFQQLLGALDALPDAAAGRAALDALQPEVYDSATSASFETAHSYADLLAERPPRCESYVSPFRRDRPSKVPCGERGLTPWVDGFGSYARRSGSGQHTDWSYGGGGLAFGVDQTLPNDLRVSGMLGTSRTALDYDGAGDASLTTFETGLAAAWRHGETHVHGVLEYGHGWSQSRRHVDIPGFSRLADAKYDSDRVTALVEASHTFAWAPFEVAPVLSGEYTWLHEDSFHESGTGLVGLDVASRDNVLFATNAGVRASMTLVKWYYVGSWLEWADGVWRPEIEASWRQVWNDYDRAFSSRLQGAPAGTPSFRTTTQDAQYGADFAARVTFQPQGTRNTVELGYEGFVGDGTMVHTVMARFRMPF